MSNIPQPSNTMTGVNITPAFLTTDDGAPKRIVYLRFKRDIYSDCHMMVAPLGAFLMGLELILKSLLAVIWIGKPKR